MYRLVKFLFCAYKYIITEIKSLNGYGVVEAKLKPEAHHKNKYVHIYLGQAVFFLQHFKFNVHARRYGLVLKNCVLVINV